MTARARRRRLRDQRHEDLDLERHRGLAASPCSSRPIPNATPRHKGMSLFIAPKQEGLHRRQASSRSSATSRSTRPSSCSRTTGSPADNLIGGVEGQGFYQATGGLELGRINVAARGVGVAEGALQLATEYAQIRKTFGKPICEHQAIQLKLGEMATRARAARLLTLDAAAAFDSRRALRHGGRHGEVLRLRSRARERDRSRCASTAPTATRRSTTSSASIAMRR